MQKKPSVLCFGEALWDLPPGDRIPGGAPMNVALRLARFGVDVRLLSRVGNDALGAELLAYLARNGIATDSIQVDDRYPTGCVFVDTCDPSAVRYEIAEPVAWDFIDAETYIAQHGVRSDVLVFGSLAARNSASRSGLLKLLEGSRLRVFDVNLRPPFVDRDVVESLLARCDWVKLNETELALIAQWIGSADAPEAAMSAVAERYHLESVCVTLGAEGAILLHREELYRQPAFRVAVVDTIGCGDAFLGCWLSEMLAGRAPQDALRRAAAVGALVAASEGANPVISEEAIRAVAGG